MDAICKDHDIAYSKAGVDLSKKHQADNVVIKQLENIPFSQRQWFSTPVKYTMQLKKITRTWVKKDKKRKEALSNDDWAQ